MYLCCADILSEVVICGSGNCRSALTVVVVHCSQGWLRLTVVTDLLLSHYCVECGSALPVL